jgi:hypothetical protein
MVAGLDGLAAHAVSGKRRSTPGDGIAGDGTPCPRGRARQFTSVSAKADPRSADGASITQHRIKRAATIGDGGLESTNF